jgi:hypothetical protein
MGMYRVHGVEPVKTRKGMRDASEPDRVVRAREKYMIASTRLLGWAVRAAFPRPLADDVHYGILVGLGSTPHV